MSQAESAADQPAAWKHVLNLFRRGACGHVEVLGVFTQYQITDTAAHDKSFEARFLELADDLGRVWAEVS